MSRTGAATPWREWDGEDGPTGPLVYYRDGVLMGERGMLVEALRADGVAYSTGDAWHMVNDAEIERGYYGFVDESAFPTVCDEWGATEDGEHVATAWPCMFAIIGDTP